MIRIEYSTRHPIEVAREEIAGMVSAYLEDGGQITVLQGFQPVERPKPSFNHKIHSEREKAKRTRYAKPGAPRTPPERRAELAKQLQQLAAEGMAKWTAIERLNCGKELAVFIVEEYGITFRKKTIKDVADQFCGEAA